MGRNNTSKMMLLVIAFAGIAQASPLVHEGTLNGFVGPARPDPVPTDYQISIGYGDPSNTLTTDIWFSQSGIYDFGYDSRLNTFIGKLSNGILDPIWISLTDHYGSTRDCILNWGENYIFGLSDDQPVPFEITGIRVNILEVNPPKLDIGYAGSVALRFDMIGVPEPTSSVLLLLGFCGVQVLRSRHVRRR